MTICIKRHKKHTKHCRALHQHKKHKKQRHQHKKHSTTAPAPTPHSNTPVDKAYNPLDNIADHAVFQTCASGPDKDGPTLCVPSNNNGGAPVPPPPRG